MTKYEKRLNKCYEVYAKDESCTIEEVKKFLREEWGEEGVRGYGIFVSDETEALHIQRIDEMDVFDGDIEAAKQARKDGIKLIPYNEVTHRYPYCCMRFIDTPENREILRKEGALRA